MKNIFSSVLIATTICLAACAPRGETHTLETVLHTAKARYAALNATGLDSDASASLAKLVEGLKQMEGGQAPAALANQNADLLTQLESKAGYTSRPSMHELIGQFKALPSTANAAATKLLVARTYNLLASELETTRFAVR